MAGGKKITIDMIEAAQRKGWSVAQTARFYGFHRKSVDAACERFGLMLPMSIYSPQRPSARRKPIIVWEDHIDKPKPSKVAFSASPAAIERALAKTKAQGPRADAQ